jgi:rhodanese-related sulfurtransferase/SHS2 domain-containing protein
MAGMSARPDLIDVEVAHEYFEEGRAQFLDARPPLEYQHSRERIPGAVPVDPGGGAAETETLLALPRGKLLISYCDEPGQAASTEVARRVRALGLGDGSALAGGFRAWKEAGYPTELAPPLASPAKKDQRVASHVVERTPEGVRLTVDAPSLAALFAEAALALADALGEPQRELEPTDHLVTVRARDTETLLTVWLVDLLTRTVEERRLVVAIRIESLSDHELHARLRGAEVAAWWMEPRPLPPEVRIERRDGGFAAMITLVG